MNYFTELPHLKIYSSYLLVVLEKYINIFTAGVTCVYCTGERVIFTYFYTDTSRLSGWFDADDNPVRGLWHHVDVGCIVIVLRILPVFECRQ